MAQSADEGAGSGRVIYPRLAERKAETTFSRSLTMITRDPFCKPWKRTERVIAEAKRREWETIIALDIRSCDDCCYKLGTLTPSKIVVWKPTRDSCDEMIDSIVRQATGEMVLMLADDEEPSRSLWDFQPPALANYAVKLVTPTPDGRVYALGTELQCRLVDPRTWKWVGGVAGFDDVGGKGVLADHLVMWHFATFAPREVREAKLANYKTLGADDHFGERHIYERRPDAIIPMTAKLKAEYPR